MKRAIFIGFIGFLAVILMTPATAKIVGAQEEGPCTFQAPQMSSDDNPDGISYSWLEFFTIIPCRANDSRTSPGHKIAGGSYWYLNNHWDCPDISLQAKAQMVNIAAAYPDGSGYITAWATGDTKPITAVLNYGAISGLPAISNSVIVPVNPNEYYEMTLYIHRTTHVVVDVLGYFY